MASAADVSIDAFLAGLGLNGADAARARAALEDAGLTNPRKQRISAAKLERAREALGERLQLLCAACAPVATPDHRPQVRVEPAACERCGGSNNARAVRDLVEAFARAGARRALFVGGSPSFRQELGRLVGDALELRLVDGTGRVTKADAQRDIAWADVVVVLGATELAHKVSTLYTRDPDARRKLVVTSRRGIEAIADDVARSDTLARRAG